MALIENIKSELRSIAQAQVGINSWRYANPADINHLLDITYPLFVHHKIREGTWMDRKSGYKTYQITIGFYDDYNEAEKVNTDYDEKQAELEVLGDHYMREFDARSSTNSPPRDWLRKSGDEETTIVEWIENHGNQKLAAYEISFELQVPEDCTTGTFNYT